MQTNETIDPNTPDLNSLVTEIRGGWAKVKDLPDTIAGLQTGLDQLTQRVTDLRRTSLSRATPSASRPSGRVSDDCARFIAAQAIAHCERSGRLGAICAVPSQRDALLQTARETLDVTTRAALATTDIPLPIQYSGQLRELISEFGVARRQMFHYPIGMGTAKPARMGLRAAFGSIAMSAAFTEKSPSIDFASLESHKVGGVVRLPREIDEQSIVPMGQFLARYGAIEFARAEDDWAFNANGSGTYESVAGIIKVATDQFKTIQLAAGKTKPSDATLDDFRAMRTKVNKAALNGRISAYYLDSTWESKLPAFRTPQEPHVYDRRPDGSAILDGYPIVWTDVMQGYGTTAAPGKAIAVFGALSYWWFGEHGSPRIDTSDHVFFINDQLAVRFIEEIDFDYCAVDATSALLTAAS